MEQARTRDLRTFARDVLLAHGAAAVREEDGALVVETGALAGELGRPDLRLVFDREGAARDPSALMVAPGAPFLATLLGLARQATGVTRVVLPARTPLAREAVVAELNGRGAEALRAARRRASLLRVHVLATAVAGEREQQLLTIVWDAGRRVVAEDGELPPADLAPTAAANGDGALSAREVRLALDGVQTEVARRMRRSLGRLKRRADELLEERIATLGGYYRELIREEGERRPGPEAGNGDRVRQIKLEWERKISAERDRVRPSGTIRVVALEEISVPRSVVSVGRAPRAQLLFDHAAGVLLQLACTRCAGRTRVVTLRGTARLCRRCDRAGAGTA